MLIIDYNSGGYTMDRFCTMITRQLTHRCLCLSFWPKIKPDLAPTDFFLPKTEDTDERKAFCYDLGDKRKIKTGAVGDTKKLVSEVFRGLENTLA